MISVGFVLKVSTDYSRGTIMLLAIVGPTVLLCEHYFWRAISRTQLNTENYAAVMCW